MATLSEMRATENVGGTVPLQDRRKYDTSDGIILMGLAQSPLLNIMSRKMMKKMTDDPEYKHWSDLELTYKGTLEGSDADGNAAAIATGTEYFKGTNLGIMMQVGAQLYMESEQVNQTNTAPAIHGEVCICETKITNDVIKVKRGGGDGKLSTNVTAGSGKTLNWVAMGVTYQRRRRDWYWLYRDTDRGQ